METRDTFDLGLPGYTVRSLALPDAPAMQRLYEQCLDYCLLVDGRPPSPDAAVEDFSSAPPGKALADKFLFGIVGPQGQLVGLLDALRRYPDDVTWWIGLLLFAPEARAGGLGAAVVRGFASYAQAHGAQALMLGVVDENTRALQFWTRQGFEQVHTTEPRQFGVKTHVVHVMRRALPRPSADLGLVSEPEDDLSYGL